MKNLILNIIANNSANSIKEILNYVAKGKSYMSVERLDARKAINDLINEGKIRMENIKVENVDYLVPAYYLTDEYAECHLNK